MYWENSLWGRRGEAAGSSENGHQYRYQSTSKPIGFDVKPGTDGV
jgi:hypothetical protein